jgi:two-component system, chemotaxis family, chemotaxis protein CheY
MSSSGSFHWILVAEDNADIRSIIRESLMSQAGGMKLQIVEAENGQEAIHQAGLRQFHCVITDLKMPRMGGDEFIRKMQSEPMNAGTPTLVVTGFANTEFKKFTSMHSHIKVFPKPFEPAALAQTALKEIRMGRIDSRLPVHLMNPFLRSIQKLADQDMLLQTQLFKPSIKKPDEGLIGEYHCTLNLVTEVSRARIVLSFEKEFLEFAKAVYVSERTSSWAAMSPESIARFMSTEIFENCADEIRPLMGGEPRIFNQSVFHTNTNLEDADFYRQTGAIAVIRTDQGRVSIGAFHQDKTKR